MSAYLIANNCRSLVTFFMVGRYMCHYQRKLRANIVFIVTQ